MTRIAGPIPRFRARRESIIMKNLKMFAVFSLLVFGAACSSESQVPTVGSGGATSGAPGGVAGTPLPTAGAPSAAGGSSGVAADPSVGGAGESSQAGVTSAGGHVDAGGPNSAGGSTNASGAGGKPDSGVAGSSDSAGAPGSSVLAATPPMGWNSWNKFACNINDSEVRAIADAMVSSGMKDVGYQYINIDDCWQTSRDASGTIVPGSNFPNMKSLADYVHGKGLKLGIYSDRGDKTCGGRPGSGGHETQDAKTYAAWGIDYLKYDNCNAPANTMQAGYTTMGNALKASGRPIVFSICAWEFQSWMPSVGQLWRTTLDIKANWASITSMMDQNAEYAQYAGPGHWNDPDMLEVGNGSLSDNQNRAHFGMWAMMASPLIAGNDLRSMSAATKAILTATEVIAIDQDALGVQGTRIKGKGALEVWKKKLSGTNTVAVALLNRTNAAADIAVTWDEAGLPTGAAIVRDVWAKSDLGSFTGTYMAKAVPSNGIALLKITAQ